MDYAWKDYTYTFGKSNAQVEKEFGVLYDGIALLMDNVYERAIVFSFDNDAVIDYSTVYNEDISSENIKNYFSSKYKFIRESDDKTYLVYRDDEDINKAKVQIQYAPSNQIAVFFDLDYYVRGGTKTRSIDNDIFFKSTTSNIVNKIKSTKNIR